MRIIESIDLELTESSSRFQKLFGILRSNLNRKPISIRALRDTMLKMVREDSLAFQQQARGYIENILDRIPGVYTDESGQSLFPIIVNLENETAFEGAVYVADGNNNTSLSASSIKGLVDRLFEEHPGGLVANKNAMGHVTVMGYDSNGSPVTYYVYNSPNRLKPNYDEAKYIVDAFGGD